MADPDKPSSPEVDPPTPEEPWAGNEERRADYLGALMAGKAYRIPSTKPPLEPPAEPWVGNEERVASYLLDRVNGKIPDPVTGKPFKPKKGK